MLNMLGGSPPPTHPSCCPHPPPPRPSPFQAVQPEMRWGGGGAGGLLGRVLSCSVRKRAPCRACAAASVLWTMCGGVCNVQNGQHGSSCTVQPNRGPASLLERRPLLSLPGRPPMLVPQARRSWGAGLEQSTHVPPPLRHSNIERGGVRVTLLRLGVNCVVVQLLPTMRGACQPAGLNLHLFSLRALQAHITTGVPRHHGPPARTPCAARTPRRSPAAWRPRPHPACARREVTGSARPACHGPPSASLSPSNHSRVRSAHRMRATSPWPQWAARIRLVEPPDRVAASTRAPLSRSSLTAATRPARAA